MTQTTDPRNTYLNPKGVPAIISRYAPFVEDQPLSRLESAMLNKPRFSDMTDRQLRQARVEAEVKGDGTIADRITRTIVDRKSRPNRVDPALEARVPAGRYAVDTPNGVRFYHVDKPSKGNWKGWTFVKIQASDDLHPVRSVAQRTGVLESIAADPRAASERYGRELGVCGVCGRTLTDEASRARGIGPICESKF